jgi:serine/threonine protein phosphatase PrpC
MKLVAASLTDTGRVRPNNEDSAGFYEPSSEKEQRSAGWLFLVADGMGGHKGGEIASSLAVKSIQSAFIADDGEDRGLVLVSAVEHANRLVLNESMADTSLTGMGTTCTAMAIQGGNAFFAHVGDSRAYILREGEMIQITQDHSLVGEMVRSGILSDEDARVHPKRNVITRSLGIQRAVMLDTPFTPFELHADDVFLLCSDGLTSMIDDPEIEVMLGTAEPDAVCRNLVEAANQSGGRDNITVVVVKINEL